MSLTELLAIEDSTQEESDIMLYMILNDFDSYVDLPDGTRSFKKI